MLFNSDGRSIKDRLALQLSRLPFDFYNRFIDGALQLNRMLDFNLYDQIIRLATLSSSPMS